MSGAPAAGKWGDLGPRLASAAVMIAVALMAIWLGGLVFAVAVAAVCGLMVWELIRMVAPAAPGMAVQLACLGAGAVLLASLAPTAFAAPLVLAPGLVAAAQAPAPRKLTVLGYVALICVAGLALVMMREALLISWIFWLIIVVVVTDVLGYFAGKTFGGPKFWPAISPKKTWSGTAAGWAGAAVVGAIFGYNSGIMGQMIVASVLLSFAGQMGDIAESAIKRRSGVKDSSDLIPGHGGVLDRFDAIIAAAAAFLLLSVLFGFPVRMLS